jgi:hypothetical protein
MVEQPVGLVGLVVLAVELIAALPVVVPELRGRVVQVVMGQVDDLQAAVADTVQPVKMAVLSRDAQVMVGMD